MAGDPAAFDSQFFTMSNTEVMTMDPQQRIMMENVYHALENGWFPLTPRLVILDWVLTWVWPS